VSDDALRRVDTLIQVGLRLARSARSGRVLLARIRDAIDLDWVPLPWGEQLASELQAASESAREPLSARQVERVLRNAWEVRATEELDELETEPVAVTPTSQVHRGVLDGEPVAIKVLRPGLAGSVRQDLALLEGLVSPLAAAFPSLDAVAVLGEFRERILDELDLENEATAQRRFHRALRGHPFLIVPAPVMRLAHEGVLVSEWVDGVPLYRAPDPEQAASRLLVFVLGALVAGDAHADPVPEDVLVLPDDRLAILDFGATRSVNRQRLAIATAALDAFAADDSDAFAAAVGSLGALPESEGPAALELFRHALGDLACGAPARLDSSAVLAARDRLLSRRDALVDVILAGRIAPEDLWPLRGVAQLFATIARIGATGDWVELSRAALREGWGC
jgi:predicted unusual protein kinase regulating ubiquinone biosynthesis (AarF/ABC1/UbiB family)